MNRVIKTRAWDKVLKEMHYWTLEEIWQSELMPDFKEYEIMLWTGLLGKAGKEIYEGDICRMQDSRPARSSYEVYWNDDRWGLRDKDGGDYDNGDYYRGDIINWQEAEVIGNVYESPERRL